MSAFGPKRTYPCAVQESAFGPKRTLTTKFYRGALRSREGFRSFRPNGTSDDAVSRECHAPSRLHFFSRRRVGRLLPRCDRSEPIQGLPCRYAPSGCADRREIAAWGDLKKLEQHGYALGKNL